ncbi:MAG TPA: monovalent cation/H+ antiporter subunit A [Thermodesulfobacteriota bacterium]
MSDALLLTTVIVLPFAGSLAAALFPTNARNAEAWLAGAVALAGLVVTSLFYADVADGRVVRVEFDWLPQFGLAFVLRLDGFAWTFAVLVAGIGLLVVLYARYYMSPADPVPRFFAYLLAFMGAMLGVVLSGNLIQLVFFWELTSLFSFLLIGYWHHRPSARDAARVALTVTAAGGLCLLAGVLVLGHVVGGYDLDRVLASGDRIVSHPLYPAVLILVLVGAFTKSAQVPFQFWLPRAMAAPTPVSAYLHSATLVKAGVFVLARLWPVMSGSEYWFWLVATTGVATMLLGAFLALFQHDLKGLLAYSTISHLGLITLLLGLGSPPGMVAAVFHTLNHATFKASLFMAAGVIDHEAGTRDIRRLGGLHRAMPITAALATVAAAAMAGVPLLNGFLSKEMFFTETIETHVDSALDDALPFVATVAGMFTVAYSLRFIHQVFFGPPATDLPRKPHEPPRWMLVPIAVLALACVLVGIFPGRTVGPILATALPAVLGTEPPAYSLAIWHGVTLALVMSVAALAGGVVVYLLLQGYLSRSAEGAPLLRALEGRRIFERALVALSWRWGRALEERLGTRRLQPQLRLLVGAAIAAAAWPLSVRAVGWAPFAWSGVDVAFLLLWVVGGACAVGAARQAKYHRFAALVMTGGAGLVTCVTFAWFSAPDLALTQVLVEIVTTVLLLLGLRWLPKRREEIPASRTAAARLRRLGDLAIATVAGAGLAALAYAVMTRPLADSIARRFLDDAYTEGGGRNVVNVILVDFRGFDTLGEITVLGTVALTVYALLRRFRPAPDSVEPPEAQRVAGARPADHPEQEGEEKIAAPLLVPGLIARLLFPVIALVAVFLFLRGHDMPGGGFVAGLTLAIGIVVLYIVAGTRWVEARLRVLPARWIGAGLLIAAGTGAGAWVFGYPFLTSASAHADLPVVGRVPMATALLFDAGVLALVFGTTVLVLIALAHQSIRVRRAAAAPKAEVQAGRGA